MAISYCLKRNHKLFEELEQNKLRHYGNKIKKNNQRSNVKKFPVVQDKLLSDFDGYNADALMNDCKP